jgi:phage-related protein
LKAIEFLGDSLKRLQEFPVPARRAAGFQLHLIQNGRDPDDWKPISAVGHGVREIRIRGDDGGFRVIYLTQRPEAVYVLHAFQKKSQKMPRRDFELAMARYRELMRR